MNSPSLTHPRLVLLLPDTVPYIVRQATLRRCTGTCILVQYFRRYRAEDPDTVMLGTKFFVFFSCFEFDIFFF